VHVLEHVHNVREVLAAIHSRLVADGSSIHVCPNYAFPYDPHFGIPLIPFAPRLTARVLPSRICESAMWGSLNFVTARQLSADASALGLESLYRPRVMADMVTRLGTDEIFRDRHATLARVTDRLLARGFLMRVLERWPSALASPMIVELRHADHVNR
jgi:hypothetical protein